MPTYKRTYEYSFTRPYSRKNGYAKYIHIFRIILQETYITRSQLVKRVLKVDLKKQRGYYCNFFYNAKRLGYIDTVRFRMQNNKLQTYIVPTQKLYDYWLTHFNELPKAK